MGLLGNNVGANWDFSEILLGKTRRQEARLGGG